MSIYAEGSYNGIITFCRIFKTVIYRLGNANDADIVPGFL
jgi:hypothetical protein